MYRRALRTASVGFMSPTVRAIACGGDGVSSVATAPLTVRRGVLRVGRLRVVEEVLGSGARTSAHQCVALHVSARCVSGSSR